MSMRAHHGFTIIETVLFLGVTGLMLATMFIGVGTSMGTQRYRDSVESFKSVLQQQYADVASVQNARAGSWTCAVASGNLVVQPVTGGAATGNSRGQSGCDIIGKYMTIVGDKIQTQTVLALRSGDPTGANDIIKLKSSAYTFGVTSADAVTTQLEWGAKIAWPVGTDPADRSPTTPGSERQIALLFIRSPDSGSVYTFSSNTVPVSGPNNASVKAMLGTGTSNDPARAERLLCIDPDGMVLTPRRGIFIDAQAADSSAIRTAAETNFTARQKC